MQKYKFPRLNTNTQKFFNQGKYSHNEWNIQI